MSNNNLGASYPEFLALYTHNNINPDDLGKAAVGRNRWRRAIQSGIEVSERRREHQWEEKRERRQQRH